MIIELTPQEKKMLIKLRIDDHDFINNDYRDRYGD
jgi:hypothetical protein